MTLWSPPTLHPPTLDPCRNAKRTGSRTGVSHDGDHERGFLRGAASAHTADVFARVGGGELHQPQVAVGDLWKEKSTAGLGFPISALTTCPSPLLCQRDCLLPPCGGQSHPHLVARGQLSLSPRPGERGLGLARSKARQIQGASFNDGGGGSLNPRGWGWPCSGRKVETLGVSWACPTAGQGCQRGGGEQRRLTAGGALAILDGDQQCSLLDGAGAADAADVLARVGRGDLRDAETSARNLPGRRKLATHHSGPHPIAPLAVSSPAGPPSSEELGRLKVEDRHPHPSEAK